MIHYPEASAPANLIVYSADFFSRDSVHLKAGHSYQVICHKGQKWWDWFIPCSATGYNNPFAKKLGMRLPNEKCFALCGAFDKNDQTAFVVGNAATIAPSGTERHLFFFANDYHKAYWNNWGKLRITVSQL